MTCDILKMVRRRDPEFRKFDDALEAITPLYTRCIEPFVTMPSPSFFKGIRFEIEMNDPTFDTAWRGPSCVLIAEDTDYSELRWEVMITPRFGETPCVVAYSSYWTNSLGNRVSGLGTSLNRWAYPNPGHELRTVCFCFAPSPLNDFHNLSKVDEFHSNVASLVGRWVDRHAEISGMKGLV